MSEQIISQVIEQLRKLPDHLQQEVLSYVHSLESFRQPGLPGWELVQYAGSLSQDEAEIMRDFIKSIC